MSKPRPKMRSKQGRCVGKQVFETLEAAQAAAKRTPFRKLAATGDFMHGYKCPKCRKFHFGHPGKQRR